MAKEQIGVGRCGLRREGVWWMENYEEKTSREGGILAKFT